MTMNEGAITKKAFKIVEELKLYKHLCNAVSSIRDVNIDINIRNAIIIIIIIKPSDKNVIQKKLKIN
jgi:hypothetical protein